MNTNYKKQIHNIWILSLNETWKHINHFCIRSFAFIESKNDKVYLYGKKDYDKDHINYLCNLFEFPSKNIVYTPAKYSVLFSDIINMSKSNEDNLENWILSQYKKYDKIVIRSYLSIPFALEWYNSYLINKHPFLQNIVKLEMESIKWMKTFGNKLMLHRAFINKNDSLSIAEKYGVDKINGLKIPQGFHVKNKKELIDSYKYFVNILKIKHVVLKPISGCGGKGIVFINDWQQLHEYEYPIYHQSEFDNFGQSNIMNIEENLCKTVSHECKWILADYLPDGTVAEPLVQNMNDAAFSGCVTYQNKKRRDKITKILASIIDIIRPNTFGGFDFYVNSNDDMYIVDVNTARLCAAHYALHLKKKWNVKLVENKYIFVPENNQISFNKLYKILSDTNVLFNSEIKCGVIPFGYSKFHTPWTFTIFANSVPQFKRYQMQLNQLLSNHNLIQEPSLSKL